MALKCEYKLDPTQLFVNPYNFVSTDFSSDKSKPDEQDSSYISGKIKCILLTKTPVAIIDTDPEKITRIKTEDGDHKIYPFFRTLDNKLVIPASSLRGPIRSVYETITNSCYPTQSIEKSILSARSSVSTSNPGIICRDLQGHWHLYEAVAGRFRPEDGFESAWINGEVDGIREGEEITHLVKIGRDCEEYLTGMLVIGEPIDKKKNVYVFEQKTLYPISSKVMDLLVKRLEIGIDEFYQKVSVNKKLGNEHQGYKRYRSMLKNGIAPVWYRVTGSKVPEVILSPACIGRNVFYNTENTLLGTKGRCSSRANRCRACDLFGMIGDNNQSQGSKIRFTDATCMKNDMTDNRYYRLRELAGPKNSYFPFYLKYPYFGVTKGVSNKSLLNALGYDSPGIELRGRKYYWHSKNADSLNVCLQHARDLSDEDRVPINKRNQTVETVSPNAEFEFEIYFDQITKKQLYELVWAINFWDNDKNGHLCHKIGHGKPIGLGSVKIIVSEIDYRSYKEGEYNIIVKKFEDIQADNPFGELEDVSKNRNKASKQTIKELLTIVDFNNLMDVEYPGIVADEDLIRKVDLQDEDNELAAHKWFYENKKKDKIDKNTDFQPLPQILDTEGKWDSSRMNMKKYRAFESN